MAEKEMKRYNLVIPMELYQEIEETAEKYHTSVVEILKKFIKIGLLAVKVEEDPKASLLIRENGTEREIIFL